MALPAIKDEGDDLNTKTVVKIELPRNLPPIALTTQTDTSQTGIMGCGSIKWK